MSMEKSQKLALARKKLRKFQSKAEATGPATSVMNGGMNSLPTQLHRNVRRFSGNGQPQDVSTSLVFADGRGEQVHSQTIDILVAEKSELVQQLAQTRAQLESCIKECLQCDGLVQELRKRAEKEERESSRLAHELSLKTEMLARSEAQYSEQQVVMTQSSSSQEDLKEENAQLISRTSSQAHELASMRQQMEKLHSQLAMQELLTLQLQASPPSTPGQPSEGHSLGREEMEELQGDIHRLNGCLQAVTRERDQALSDLAALREAMLSQQEHSARKLGDYQTHLVEANLRITMLTERLTALERDQEASAHARFKEVESSQLMQQSLQEENSYLLGQVKQLLADNKHINSLNCQLEADLASVQQDRSQVQGELAEQHRLLASIAQDKETISRAVSQNKDLKEQLTELQEAFVKQSHQNMELATELETERHRRLQAVRSQQQMDGSEGDPDENPPIFQEPPATLSKEAGEEKSRLEDLTLECSSLHQEKEELLAELARLQTTSSAAPEIMDQEEDGSLFQQSFTALQQRFVAVMGDKAALLEQLQQYEHTIMQLSGETETIGEYVTLYQTQRAALRLKFKEKDFYIQQLLQDKASLEAKLREVQSLMQQLRTSTGAIPPDLPTHLRPTHNSNNLSEVERIMHVLESELVTAPLITETPGHCPCCSGQLLLV